MTLRPINGIRPPNVSNIEGIRYCHEYGRPPLPEIRTMLASILKGPVQLYIMFAIEIRLAFDGVDGGLEGDTVGASDASCTLLTGW